MLPLKPHSIRVAGIDPRTGGQISLSPGEAPEFTVRGSCQPSTPGIAYERFGVNSKQPYELWVDSAGGFEIGGTVRALGREFSVLAIQAHEATGTPLDHARILLEVRS